MQIRWTKIAIILIIVPLCLILGKDAIGIATLKVTSPAFAANGQIPKQYTCDGRDISPPLQIAAIPPGTRSLAIICDDPDAPAGTWVHWVVWNIDPSVREIKEGSLPKGAIEGINDFGRRAYGGPCPPSGQHRYFFKVYALDTTLDIPLNSTKADLEKAMKEHILGQGEIVGLYRRR